MTVPQPRIEPATCPDAIAAVGVLFRAYAASLPVDLGYQGFEAELAGLPGAYAPPAGALLLARDAEGVPLGCVAVRPSGPAAGVCEMKRLYVAPAGRGSGLGRALVHAAIAAAAGAGHREMRLDTLPSMHGAQALYRALGFTAMPPYYDTPVAGTLFMRLMLPAAGEGPAATPCGR